MSNTISRPLRYMALFALTTAGAMAADIAPLPRQNSVPGGIAIVALTDYASPNTPEVLYNGQRTLVKRVDGQWHAVIGIPLDTAAGEHFVEVKRHDRISQLAFTVVDKEYKTQHLTVKNKRHVNPSAEDLERIKRESELMQVAFTTWTEEDAVPGRFTLPVQGRFSSPFGLRRFFNKEPRKPHSGLDIAAKIGTAINAPAAGTVSTTGDFFFNGNTVFLDHGQGLISMYCHMNSIEVKKGDKILPGQRIGTVGKSGRVTGPHLHWSVSLNNTRVDPVLFFTDETIAGLK